MRSKFLSMWGLFVLMATNQATAQNIGFSQVILDPQSQRPLPVAVWYPTRESGAEEWVGENPVFVGTQVIVNAEPATKAAPVVLLSHGYRGNWRNLNWLAVELARLGYIVAAPDHPGTTTFDTAAHKASQWWQRVTDLSRTLDYLSGTTPWSAVIDPQDVTAIGHSLGGWTVMQLAGAEFDRARLQSDCLTSNKPRTCGLAQELGLSEPQVGEPSSANLSDIRIQRVISLDLGLARSFSVSSLRSIDIPVLILAAGIDIGDLPQAEESGYLAEFLPLSARRYHVYHQATHFSFIQLCKPGAVERLEAEVPGDGIVCKDGRSTSRVLLHEQMLADIVDFLSH